MDRRAEDGVGDGVGDDDRIELRLWLRLFAAAGLMETRVRRHLKRRFGATLPRFDVLAQLHRAPPEGLTMGELSRRLMVSNGNTTGLVERLAVEGLVERRPDPGDRRVQRVRLGRAGRELFERMVPENRRWISDMLAGLDSDETEQLCRLLGRLKQSVLESNE